MTAPARVGRANPVANGLARTDRALVRRSGQTSRRLYQRASLKAAKAGVSLTCDAPLFFGDTMRVTTSDVVGALIHWFGIWEPQLTRVAEQALEPGDVFVDVGANIGYWSLLGSHLVGPSGRVVAFEASPSIHAELLANLERNGRANVEVHNVAVSDGPGELQIFKGPRANRGITSIHATDEHRLEATVPADTLANLLDDDAVDRCKVLKIDVEGAEDLVVAGMGGLVERLRPDCHVLLEVDLDRHAANHDDGVEAVLGPFRSAGFTVQRLRNNYQPRFYLQDHTAARPEAVDDLGTTGMRDLLLTRLS